MNDNNCFPNGDAFKDISHFYLDTYLIFEYIPESFLFNSENWICI